MTVPAPKIATVANFAFVMPAYDYTDVHDLSPAQDVRDAVAWMAWGWNHEDQAWEPLGDDLHEFYETRSEARARAMEHHEKLVAYVNGAREP